MAIKNYQEVCDALYLHLEDFLTDHSINTNKLFKCINPAHVDKAASCGLAPSKQVFHCFGCGFSGNIFHAAHLLDGKPIVGSEFVHETLVPLAEKYKISVEMEPLTEEEIYEMDTYRAYRTASDLVINGHKHELYKQIITEKGWSDDICKEYGIGCVASYKEFRESLKRHGFQASFLDDIDLDRKEVFGEDRLVFTIKDEHGRPVGFSSRNLSYTDDEKNGSKYCNQKSTGVKCNIYRKSSRLYGFDRVLEHNPKGGAPIFVFEGYGDVVTAANNGLFNCVALGGLTLTIDQLFLLKKHNFFHIILCLDGDAAGQKRVLELLDNILNGQRDLRVQIVFVPDGLDPDEFVRKEGMPAFLGLKVWDAFEWRLAQFAPTTEPEKICDSMIPFIANEPSYITQEKLCRMLAEATGISLKAISADLERLQNQHAATVARERRTIIDEAIALINREPDSAEGVLSRAIDSLYDLAKKNDEDAFSEQASMHTVMEQQAAQDAKDGKFSGYILGPDLEGLCNALSGNWTEDVWITIGGKENCGKTSLAVKIADAIASHFADNNAMVIYHSIDDTIPQILPKFVCVNDGSRMLTLNQVDDPPYHIHKKLAAPLAQTLAAQRSDAYAKLLQKMQSGLLVLKDKNDGIGLEYTEQLIRYFRAKFPDRKIVYVLDNFHLLPEANGERIVIKHLSNRVKSIATKYHIALITTVEYRKTSEKPTNEDISETGQISYDANVIMHVYNESHIKGAKANPALIHYHQASDSAEPVLMPIIELNISKNKVSTFKGSLYYKFYTNSSDFAEVSAVAVKEKMDSIRRNKKGNSLESLPFGQFTDG